MEYFYSDKSRMPSATPSFAPTQSAVHLSPQPTPGQLRPLPGYGLPASPAAAPAPPPTTAPPTSTNYVTRERLYYEPVDRLTSGFAAASSSSQAGGNRNSQSSTVVARLADEAPPAVSLHEVGTLTPDRKHAVTPVGEAAEDTGGVAVAKGVPPAAIAQPSEGNWVTVFGFAGGQSALVLAYFKKLGVVEEHEVGQGNWIHLKYSTLWAAQKALAKNGIIMAGGIMVGVIPTDRAIEQVSLAADSFMSPIKRESLAPARPADERDPKDAIFIRPGLLSPQANPPTATAPAAATTTTAIAPEEGSLVTKALGYVFGW